MADTKSTYPDGNAGYPSDGNKQGGKSAGQSNEKQNNTTANTEDCR